MGLSGRNSRISSSPGLREGRSIHRAVDSVVLAVGSVSKNELVNEVEGMAEEVHVIGDASKPRNALSAIREGAEVGRRI